MSSGSAAAVGHIMALNMKTVSLKKPSSGYRSRNAGSSPLRKLARFTRGKPICSEEKERKKRIKGRKGSEE